MGKLYGIGVGPGDPELLTLKAHRVLNEADVIFCPEKEAGAGSFAFDIIQGLFGGHKGGNRKFSLSDALSRHAAARKCGSRTRVVSRSI